MGDKDEVLHGFTWRSGIKTATLGIIIWNDVFLYTTEDGDKLAIIVLDTEGLFDQEMTPNDNLRVTLLSTLLSSIHIFNLSNSMQNYLLTHLKTATNVAKLMLTYDLDVSEKPFQALLFLFRDWVRCLC